MARMLRDGTALLLCLFSIIVSESAKQKTDKTEALLEISEDGLEKAVQDHSLLMVLIRVRA